jgi:RHS repeat-associated protein
LRRSARGGERRGGKGAGFGRLVSQNRSGTERYFHYDALGSTRALTDVNKTVTDTYIYSAFGETTQLTGSTTNPFRWVAQLGYYYDTERDAYHVRARHYTPSLARWLSVDPLFPEDGLTLYNYVHNMLLIVFDASGRLAPLREYKRNKVESGTLVYTCRCGWLDFSHARRFPDLRRMVSEIAHGTKREHFGSFYVRFGMTASNFPFLKNIKVVNDCEI